MRLWFYLYQNAVSRADDFVEFHSTFWHNLVLVHAKIGFHHIFKIRYFGATTVTLHHRLGAVEGQWRVLESARV